MQSSRFVVFVLVFVLPCFSAEAQTDAVTSLQLTMPTPMVTIDRKGRLALCVEYLPRTNSADGFVGKESVTRIATVDLDNMEVLAQSDLLPKFYSFAIENGKVYTLAAHSGESQSRSDDSIDGVTLEVRDALTHEIERSEKVATKAVRQFNVIGNQLLCTVDGAFRISLSTLQPSKRWASPAPGTKPRISPEVFATMGGFILDGVIYDEKLAPQLIVASYMGRKPLAHYELTKASGNESPYSGDSVHLGSIYCKDLPMQVSTSMPRSLGPSGDAAITLKSSFGGSVIGEISFGEIKQDYFESDANGSFKAWRRSSLNFRLKKHARFNLYKALQTRFYGGGGETPLAMASAGNRLILASGSTLYRVALDQLEHHPSTNTVSLQRKQSTLSISPLEDAVLEHSVNSPIDGVAFTASVPSKFTSLDFTVNAETGEVRIPATSLQQTVKQSVCLLGEGERRSHEAMATKLYKQVFGKRPQGSVFMQPVIVTASLNSKESKWSDTLKYAILIDAPTSMMTEFESKKTQIADAFADQQRAESERRAKAEQANAELAASQEFERQAPQRRVTRIASTALIVLPTLVVGLTLSILLLPTVLRWRHRQELSTDNEEIAGPLKQSEKYKGLTLFRSSQIVFAASILGGSAILICRQAGLLEQSLELSVLLWLVITCCVGGFGFAVQLYRFEADEKTLRQIRIAVGCVIGALVSLLPALLIAIPDIDRMVVEFASFSHVHATLIGFMCVLIGSAIYASQEVFQVSRTKGVGSPSRSSRLVLLLASLIGLFCFLSARIAPSMVEGGFAWMVAIGLSLAAFSLIVSASSFRHAS